MSFCILIIIQPPLRKMTDSKVKLERKIVVTAGCVEPRGAYKSASRASHDIA